MYKAIGEATAELRERGWASFIITEPRCESIEQLSLKIALSLGQPRACRTGGQLIDYLVPKSKAIAHVHSLSAQYGFNEFPWHTDGAHWSVPPRYLLMACLEADRNSAHTFVSQGQDFGLQSSAARVGLFHIKNGAHSFYATARDMHNRFYRYDPGCMKPLTEEAITVAEEVAHAAAGSQQRISWDPGKILLIDNWRCLHRRGAAAESVTRKLLRINIMERL